MSLIFKQKICNDILFNLLDKICLIKTDKYYIINIDAYKKMHLLDLYHEFIHTLKPYYKKNKQHYITRAPKYTFFLTIIRHICKANEINYSSQINYEKSNYKIMYYIYF
jgi:hypothetical protein